MLHIFNHLAGNDNARYFWKLLGISLNWTLVYNLEVLENFVLKNQTWKFDKIHQKFQIYWVFMHNFLVQNVPVLALYVLVTRKINTLWSKGNDEFWSRGMGSFWDQKKNHKRKSKIFKKISELYQVSRCPTLDTNDVH